MQRQLWMSRLYASISVWLIFSVSDLVIWAETVNHSWNNNSTVINSTVPPLMQGCFTCVSEDERLALGLDPSLGFTSSSRRFLSFFLGFFRASIPPFPSVRVLLKLLSTVRKPQNCTLQGIKRTNSILQMQMFDIYEAASFGTNLSFLLVWGHACRINRNIYIFIYFVFCSWNNVDEASF